MGGGHFDLRARFSSMFNLSTNHLFLLLRTEYRSCAVFLFKDRYRPRFYRLYDFSKAQLVRPAVAYCVAGKGTPINPIS